VRANLDRNGALRSRPANQMRRDGAGDLLRRRAQQEHAGTAAGYAVIQLDEAP
jgi:hypothetical protein